MKKTYMKPESIVCKIHTRSTILTPASDPVLRIDRSDSVDAGNVESRCGGSLWDDDEE